MGYALLVVGIVASCGGVFYILGKSNGDRKYQPDHVRNQVEIKELLEKKLEIEDIIKTNRGLMAGQITFYQKQLGEIERTLKERGLED